MHAPIPETIAEAACVVEVTAKINAVDRKLTELKASLAAVTQQLNSLAEVAPEPALSMVASILAGRSQEAVVPVDAEPLKTRCVALAADIRVLNAHRQELEKQLRHARHQATVERLQRPDVVGALKAYRAAREQMVVQRARLDELVEVLRLSEGYSDLANADFMGMLK